MKSHVLIIANIGFIIGIILGLYLKVSIILFLSIFGGFLYVCMKSNTKKLQKVSLNIYSKMNKLNKKPKNMGVIVCITLYLIIYKLFKLIKLIKVYIIKSVLILLILTIFLGSVIAKLQNYKFEYFVNSMTSVQKSNSSNVKKIDGILAEIVSDKEEKEFSDVYVIKILKVENKKYINIYCLLKLKKENKSFLYGEKIYFKGVFKEPQSAQNYKGFDYKEYLKTINIAGIFESKYADVVKIQSSESYFSLFINNIRKSIVEQVNKLYKNSPSVENKALMLGILLGDKSEFSEEQVDDFKASNLSHILAVSGMHIGYIILLTMFILKLLKVGKKALNVITIVVIFLFMELINFTPSITRAGIMSILALSSFLVKRKANVWISMSLASLITLIFNPYSLFSLSFQLSYLGTIGVLLSNKIINRHKSKDISQNDNEVIKAEKDTLKKNYSIKNIISYFTKFLKQFLVMSVTVQLIVSPIILLNFNTFSIYFLIGNFIIIPIIGTTVMICVISLLISYVNLSFACFINNISNLVLGYTNIMTNFISNLPNSLLYFKTPYIISLLIYYTCLMFFILIYLSDKNIIKRKVKKYRAKFLKVFIRILVVYICIVGLIDIGMFRKVRLELYFVNVGQGDCSLIITESNKKILIDGGGSNDKNFDVGKNTTLPYLLDRRITKLDYIIISHFDSDHVQGLYAVLQSIRVKNVIISNQKENSENYEKFLKIVQEKNIKITNIKAGDKIYFDKNTYMEILWPTAEVAISDNPLNNNSIVAKLVYKEFSVLFTGDIEEVAEKAILRMYSQNLNVLKSNILKVAHHGSKSSTSVSFLEAVQPKFALIGVGKNNLFKHPSNVTLERLEKLNVKIFRTDEDLEVIIKSDGKQMYI